MKVLSSIQTVWQLISKAPQGTPPIKVDSTTLVNNLNADMIDGKQASDLADKVHNHTAAEIASGTISSARLPAESLIGDTTYTAGTGLSLVGTTFNIDNPFSPIGNYVGLRAQATTKTDVGLGSVDNYSRAHYDGRYTPIAHASSSGAEHTYINQDMRTTAGPTFENLTLNQNLGIGTTTPEESLDVIGNTKANGFKTGDFIMEYDATSKSLQFNFIGIKG